LVQSLQQTWKVTWGDTHWWNIVCSISEVWQFAVSL